MNISDNVIDGREVIDIVTRAEKADYHRVKAELEELREKLRYANGIARKRDCARAQDCIAQLDSQARDILNDLEDEFEDIDAFEELHSEMESATGGHPDNATAIAEDYWVDYVQQLMEDLGYMTKNADSVLVIDWEATANGVAQDWTHVTLNSGESFYIR